jgi:hypothetical protein
LTTLLSGCVKIRLTVQLREDGSGRVIEDIEFSERLVDAAKRMPDAPKIEELTSDAHVKRRLAQMGKGVSLLNKKIEKQPDGSLRMVVSYAFEDINELRLAPLPYGQGWEDVHMAFQYEAEASLAAQYSLHIRLLTPEGKERRREGKPELPPLGEREAQQIRQLLPVYKDMLEGFELNLRMEVYEPQQWATTTKGHAPSAGYNPFAAAGGRMAIYQVTDKHLRNADDGLMLVVPWRQVGREFDLYHHHHPPGPRLLPHVNMMLDGGFRFGWRAIQTPRGREYF